MELWDIYDADKKPTGRTMKRNDWCLKDGEYHLTVLGVVARPDQTFLITKRVMTKAWAAIYLPIREKIRVRVTIILWTFTVLSWILTTKTCIFRQRKQMATCLQRQTRSGSLQSRGSSYIMTALSRRLKCDCVSRRKTSKI